MANLAGLERLIAPEIEHLGYALVRLAMIGGSSDPTLQVMAERPDTRQLTLADCEHISRRLSQILDLADPIEGSYRLEVSSPGIDRPLTRLKDYQDWKGQEARVTLAEPHEGRKQFTGTLEGLEHHNIKLLAKDGNIYSIPFADVSTAKLLLTDKLIASTAPLSTEGADAIKMEG